MTTKLAKIVLSIITGLLGLVLVMVVLAGAGPAVAMEDAGQDGGGALVAGVPIEVIVNRDPTEILADGDSNSTITGTVRDDSCQGVPGAFIAFTTTLGTIDQYCYVEAEGTSVNKSPGDWTEYNYAGASGGKYVKACGSVSPNWLNWTFTATAVSMLYVKGPNGGFAEVWVDNGPPITVDMCDPINTTAAERVITAGLGSGPHVITVTFKAQNNNPGCGSCIQVDAFRCGTTTDINGKATATLTSTVLSCGSQVATVGALTGDPSIPYMIYGDNYVDMTASSPHSMTVTASPNVITVGVGTSDLEATVEDKFGEYVPDCTMVSFLATDENSAAFGEAWAILPYELVEGEDTEVITSSSWSTGTHPSHHGTEVISSTTANDTAVWTFTGTAVSLIYPKLSDAGVATVTVDSGAPITIDMYAPSPGQYQIEHVITSCLNYSPHVITVTVGGYTVTGGINTRVYVDAFRSGASTSNGKATAVLTAGTQAGVVWAEATGVGRPCCEMDSVVTDTVPITLTAGNPYTLTITPAAVSITCCITSTLQFTVTDQYSNVVGAVVPRTLTVNFTSTPHARITDTNVIITQGVGSVEIHGWMSGTGTVTGTVSGYPSVFDTVNLTVEADSCHTLTVNASPPQIYVTDENTGLLADFHYTSTVTARVTDKCENPVADGTVVTFTTSLGSLSPVTQTTISGVATATLTSGQLSGAPTKTAYITVTGAGCPVSVTTSVDFGQHVYTLTVTANPDEMGVGGYTSTLAANVYDGFGGPTPDGVMVGFTITPSIRASVPYEYVEAEGAKVTAPGWAQGSAGGVTWIQTSTVGASASWTFTGTAISFIHYQQGAVTVTIDSPPYTNVLDLSGPGTWVETVITTGLNFDSRTVTVTVKDPITVYLDAFRSGTTTSSGTATATATSGTEAGVATVEAAAIGSTVTNTTLITITAGDPYSLTITPTDVSITCCVTSTLQFTVTDQYGNPVGAVVPKTLTVTFTSTPLGDFTPPSVVITEGVGSVDFHGYEAGTGTITGTVSGYPVTGTANLTITAASCYTLMIDANPTQIYVTDENTGLLADFSYTSIITAEMRDSCNNPVQNGTVVTFTTSLGNLGSDTITKTTTSGVATATLTSENLPNGVPTDTAYITVTGTGCPVSDTTSIDFGLHIYTLTVTANPDEMAVGGNNSTLTAVVTDGFGSPVLDGIMVGFTITPTTRATVPYEFVEAEDPTEVITTGWSIDPDPSYHGGRVISSTTANDTASWTFTGTAVSVMYPRLSSAGVVSVTIDSGSLITVDMYASSIQYQVEKVITNALSYGQHVITVTVAGYRNAASTANTIYLDAFRSGTTTSSGVATATVTSGTEAGVATFEAAAIGSTVTNTGQITITASDPYTLTMMPADVSITCCVTSTLQFTVTDQYSNVVGAVASRLVSVCLTCSPDELVDSWSGSHCVGVLTGTGSVDLHGWMSGTGYIEGYVSGFHPDTVVTSSLTVAAGDPVSLTVTRAPEAIPASDGDDTAVITATVSDACGNGLCNRIVTFTTDLGSFEPPPTTTLSITSTTNCSGVATATLVSRCSSGRAHITVTTDSLTETTYVDFVGLYVYEVHLVADPTSIQVGGNTSILTATVEDVGHNPVFDGTVVTFTTSLGTLGSDWITGTTTGGVATATLTSQTEAGTAVITAAADSKVATTTVQFIPLSPHLVTLAANPSSISLNGSTSTLTATVKDQFNNNVANGTVVTFTTSLGILGSDWITETTTSGVATATLTSQTEAGTAFITATADSKSGTATVIFEPDPPYTLTLVADPTTLATGESSTLSATIKDQYDNNVADGTVVTFETTLGSLGSVTITKGTTNGVATATLTSQVPGTATVVATADSVSGTVTVTFAIGPPYTVTLVAYPTTLTIGDTSMLTATVKDQGNNNVTDGTVVTFETSLGSLGSVTITKGTTNGVATATLTSQVPGTATVVATADSVSDTVNVTFEAGPPYTVTLVAYPTTLTVGDTSTLTATVKDQYDNNVTDGTVVTFETTLGSLGSVTITKGTTNGVATATLTSQVPGTATVVASADSVSDTVNVTFEVGPPYTVTLEANPTSILVGGYTSALTVTVTDQFNNNVADGTAVLLETSLGSLGSVTITKLTANGVATATLTSGDTAGTAMITATAGSKVATTVVAFTADVPYTVTLVADPTSLTVGDTSTLTATVKDQYDNNVADGTSVLFETSLGSLGSVTVTKGTANGVATAALTSQVPGTATVVATAGSVSDTVDVTFEVGPPYTVTLEANPTSILVGGFTSTLTATVTDQFDNNVADGTSVLFETSLGSLGSVTVTKPTANGVATATLTSGDTAGTAMITATAGSKVATTVVTFTADVPYTVTLVADPTSLTVGETSTLTATVKDQYDNNVADGTSVLFETSLGSLGSVTVTKGTANGVATAALTSQVPGMATITATADSKVATTTVNFEHSSPYTVTLVAYPVSLSVGSSSWLTATVKDQFNNNVADGTVVTFETSLGTLGSTTISKTTFGGVATATLTSQVAGTAMVTATSDSLSDMVKVLFNPGLPYTVTVEAYPTSIPIGWFTSTITAMIEDQYGNPVADGTEVTFATDLGSVGSSSVVKTTVNGVAIATLTSEQTIGTANVTATSDSAVGHTQVIFTIGAPYTVTAESWPPTIEVGGNTSTITATVTDIGGYAVADGTLVIFTTDFGDLGSTTVTRTTVSGVAVATLTSPQTPGVAHITAIADSKFDTAIVKVAAGPPFTIDVTADPTYIPIGGATASITTTVKDQYGNNVTNGTIVYFYTTLGNVSPSSAATNEGIAGTTLTSEDVKGTARVTAISGSAIGWVDVVFTIGPPVYVNVVASPTSIGLNGQTSNIQATVKDIGGNDVADGTEVIFTTSLGTLGSNTVTKTTTSGVATAVLTSGTAAGTAVITATADSKYDITEVTFNPDPPHTVTLTGDPMVIPANGTSTSAVRATVTDQYGNMVADGINCYFHTTLGTVWPPSDTTLDGVAETTLTSGEDPGLATVTATCGGKQGTVHVYFYHSLKLYLPVIFKGN